MPLYRVHFVKNTNISAHNELEAKIIHLRLCEKDNLLKAWYNDDYDDYIYKKKYKTFTLANQISEDRGLYFLSVVMDMDYFYYYYKSNPEIIDKLNQISLELKEKGSPFEYANRVLKTYNGLIEYIKVLGKKILIKQIDMDDEYKLLVEYINNAGIKLHIPLPLEFDIIYGITPITTKRILKKCRNNNYKHIWRLFTVKI